ncbi:DUF1206 domain-containing protein [Jannaschia formosa]|uniref:DUF1206 domain-containing protein n=1 Tax=Jannaschia formosa TaxID=2259592 RepID=UPI000E1C3442|nr:DUF1206 domain-containing protein [Jannaschia formosa]TFL17035.1 DUF1206 domain-containing protein [Jannaschia formosa]
MSDYRWSIPVMRAGYGGRGVTYLAIAGISLWAIWSGGTAQGTSSVLARLSGSTWGMVVLWLIAIGLLAYAVWRLTDAWADLEDYGSDGEGLVARAGMVVTGLIHGALGVTAALIAMGDRSGGGGSGVESAVATVLGWPAGRWILGFGALCTLGAAIYYFGKAWKASYRHKLKANRFTRKYDAALRAGVVAQGVVVGIVGFFLGLAALNGDPQEAGGLGQVFDFLANQPFGNVLVIALCLGLLGFAFFCFANAAYRIIEKVPHDDITSLGAELKAAT